MKTLVTITGPSASGKSTLERYLAQAGMNRLVSTTSRPMRAGEVDGQHYHFVSEKQFRQRVETGQMLEWKKFNGNLYGLERAEFTRKTASGPAVLVVEPNGAGRFIRMGKAYGMRVISVFVDSPLNTLLERYEKRIESGEMSEEQACKRIRGYFDEECEWKSRRRWSLYVREFTALNEHLVVDAILDFAKPDQSRVLHYDRRFDR